MRAPVGVRREARGWELFADVSTSVILSSKNQRVILLGNQITRRLHPLIPLARKTYARGSKSRTNCVYSTHDLPINSTLTQQTPITKVNSVTTPLHLSLTNHSLSPSRHRALIARLPLFCLFYYIAYFLVHSFASSSYRAGSVLKICAISGTSGSSGLGSVRSEQIDKSTLEIVNAGLHCSFRMSRQIEPCEFTLGWYTLVLKFTLGGLNG